MNKEISNVAVQESKGTSFKPYIPASANLRELTVLPLIIGTLLGMVFGASSLYLVLKVGITVSASIPVAVISISIFALLSKFGLRNATILENNIVQTAGSAGESIAFGVGVTMPAVLVLGFDLEITRVLLVGVLGGLLGILMMIPLRRALIVQQHGSLKYPEGTACAEVLKAGASEESRAAAAAAGNQEAASEATGAKTIFTGFGIGLLYQTAMGAFRLWKEVPKKVFGHPFEAGSIAAEISPTLLGVGYVIGPRIASIMCAGGVLAYLVLIPMIKFFGQAIPGALPPGTDPISSMGPDDIRGAYILYIGAGAVTAGGIISLLRAMPTIWQGIKGGLADLKGGPVATSSTLRTEQDLSMKVVIGGIIALLAMIMLFPQLNLHISNPLVAISGALMIVAFGFLFVTVSSRLTGEIGSSSNPISGMTVATLLFTCLIFLILGWTTPPYFVTALSIGGIVCIAASNGGTTSQDLKTGFLVGATPKYQQIAILVGALSSAIIFGPILLALNDSGTVYVPVTTTNVPAEFRVAPADLAQTHEEKLKGPQGTSDTSTYRVWRNPAGGTVPEGRYLVNSEGAPVYLIDPGINGKHPERPDGSSVTKFDAPKVVLMSNIVQGILGQKLPWGLVLLGVMIAIVLEMSGIPSLAFAVGVYLPLSSSSPILIGGLVRWGVDKYLAKKLAHKNLTEEQLTAEGDKSSGVLMASGYIAGGSLAGIVIAFLAGVPSLKGFNDGIEAMSKSNPFFSGTSSDLLALIPFVILIVLLYMTGREMILASKKSPTVD
jgi:putative OPT family oligopeptide transporter